MIMWRLLGLNTVLHELLNDYDWIISSKTCGIISRPCSLLD